MALIKTKHNALFKQKIDQLRSDIGRDIIVYRKSARVLCDWCFYDESTHRSSGIPRPGKVWSTHPNYFGSDIRCPQCEGRGVLNQDTQTTIQDVIIDDTSGMIYKDGKIGFVPEGTKKLIGKLGDILKDSSNVNSNLILDDAVKIVIDGEDYKPIRVKRFGLKDNYLFEAIVERMDITDVNTDTV